MDVPIVCETCGSDDCDRTDPSIGVCPGAPRPMKPTHLIRYGVLAENWTDHHLCHGLTNAKDMARYLREVGYDHIEAYSLADIDLEAFIA